MSRTRQFVLVSMLIVAWSGLVAGTSAGIVVLGALHQLGGPGPARS